MNECKYCGKEFKAFNPTDEFNKEFKERWHVYELMACHDAGTREEAIHTVKHLYNKKEWRKLHKFLWVWLALDGESEKKEWFEMFDVPKVTNYCFACEVAKIGAGCVNCPIQRDDWGECANGLYEKWVRTHKIAEREKLAREIATMKWEERL